MVNIPGNKLVYSADQFHFHRSSEHTIQGKSFDVEMHIVHSLEYGALSGYKQTKAVLGIMFDTSKDMESEFFKSINVGKPGTEIKVDLQGLFKALNKELYHYQGSLTTPPCTEVVNWFVFTTPLNISKAQANALASIWEHHMEGCHNNRIPCPINGRMIYKNFK